MRYQNLFSKKKLQGENVRRSATQGQIYKKKRIAPTRKCSQSKLDVSALNNSKESVCHVDVLQEFINKCIPFSLLIIKKKDLSQMAKKFIKNMKSTSFAPLRNVISDYMR